MEEFFIWIASLSKEQAWLLFVSVAIVMAIVPYMSLILRVFRILFSNEKPEIVDFSWRFIPDTHIADVNGKTYYVIKSELPVLYEGMVIMLNWHVKGAYSIDVSPLGKSLKGNAAHVVITADNCSFRLTAHTLKGKLTRDLTLEKEQIGQLKTLNISREELFGQPAYSLKSQRYYFNDNNPTKKAKNTLLSFLFSPQSRMYTSRLRRMFNSHKQRLYFKNTLQKEHNTTKSIVEQTLKPKAFTFNPNAYNQAVWGFKQNNKTII